MTDFHEGCPRCPQCGGHRHAGICTARIEQEKFLPGDIVRAWRDSERRHGRREPVSVPNVPVHVPHNATPAQARAYVEALAGVSGAWWKLQSPADRLEPFPGYGVIWTLMHPEGTLPNGLVGYSVHWSRNARKEAQ